MEHKAVYRNADGVRRTLVTDSDQPGLVKTYTEVDMEEVLASVRAQRDNLPARQTNRLLAKVPMTVYERSMIEQWDDSDWRRWLNDPDNVHLRVWPGEV